MTYTVEPGQVLLKRFEAGREGINLAATHAFLITDIEHFTLAAWFRAASHGLEVLAGRVLRVGLDWEHLEALMPDNPDEKTAENVAELDRLARETEILAGEIDVRTGVVDRSGRPFPPFREATGGDR
jgi:hypothetical protein